MPKKLAVLSLIFLTSLSLAGKKKDPDPIFPEVTARGRALYEYDQAAWHASDAVQALHPDEKSVGRYIAHKSAAGWTVAFGHLSDKRDAFLIAYEAIQGSNPKEFTARRLDSVREDASFYLAAAKAIDNALHDFKGENRPYNVAVLPAPSEQLYVYVLPAQTKDDIYPLGGDVRYLMAASGDTIVEKRQLHKTILEISSASLPKGATPMAGVHTHVLTDVPEDTDVFHVLTREPHRPELVMTGRKTLYEISTDGTIRQRKI